MPKIEGIAQLSARLVALGETPERLMVVWPERAVAFAKARVRVKSGETQRSIRFVRKGKTGGELRSNSTGRYLEFGTPPHPIPGGKKGGPLKGKALAFKDGGRTIFAKKVNHPRTRKHTFLKVSGNAALRDLKREIAALWDAAA